jgi:hypothetical protein
MRTLLLHLEGIASLDEEVGGLLVLVFSSAKEAEAATGALKLLLSLSFAKRQHTSDSAWRCSSSQDQGGGGEGLLNLLEESPGILSHGRGSW